MMAVEEPTDAERYPALTEHGRRMLERLREHPCAPIFRNRSGHRLLPEELPIALEAERAVLDGAIDWQPGEPPAWVQAFVVHCLREVPFYRQYGAAPSQFESLPTVSRGDLGHDIARFVPDAQPLGRLINFQTSGTTGHPLLLPSHPLVAARYLAYHKRALRCFGIELTHRRDQVGVILLGLQSKCFTYVSVTPCMDESGLAKINLHPGDWRDPHDRARYLEAMQPEVLAGDPISYAELLNLAPRIRPVALLSTSMALSGQLRHELESRFACPVVDLYSMNEAGPIAVWDASVDGHVLLQPDLYVEVLDDSGAVVPNGQRGEIVVTGGFNFCLPLLRYRTGDYASLERRGDAPVLVGLEGRPPVRFRAASGDWINNIEITHALRPYPIRQFTVHQTADGTLRVRFASAVLEVRTVAQAVHAIFGRDTPLRVEKVTGFEGKVVQYTTSYRHTAP